MNNIFEIKRFWFFLRKTLLERPAQITGLIGLMMAIILIAYFICKSQISFGAAQNITFIWGLVGGGCFLASYIFGYFSTNASGSSYLTLPASHFEKWVAAVLIVCVFYPVVFFLFYRGMDAGFVALYHQSLDPVSPLYKDQYRQVFIFPFDGILAKKVYPIYFIYTGVVMLGSLYFNKASFIKTALVFCAICFGIFGLNWLFATLIFGSIEGAFPFSDVEILQGKRSGSIPLPEATFNIFFFITVYFLPVFLWALTYVRLREKEF